MDLKETIATELDAARRRSLSLLDPLPEELQVRQHSSLMSPFVWDLAHVGNYEEIWLLRSLGVGGIAPDLDTIYNAFLTERSARASLPMLGPAEARSYVGDVRGRVLDTLERVELDPANRLVHEGYVYGMVVQHEHQHDETMLASAQLMEEGYDRFGAVAAGMVDAGTIATGAPGAAVPIEADEVLVEGGPFVMGTDDEPWAYDNERGAHVVDLPPFWIDTTPVTNAQYRRFVEASGYDDRRFWSEKGWAWRNKAGLEHPQFWRNEGQGAWSVLRFGRVEPLRDDRPVQHVCWYEAEAYAAWAGKRLPTEAEWEKAASWDPRARAKRRYPWGDDPPDAPNGSGAGDSSSPLGARDSSGRPVPLGGAVRANLGQRHDEPASVGAYPAGVSPWGCHQMLGDVWEWTASDFLPYPGYASFPYVEYSEVFFGDRFKVLRGGSWATHPTAIRCTFRNWDFPIRRQIFAGFRCARDAA